MDCFRTRVTVERLSAEGVFEVDLIEVTATDESPERSLETCNQATQAALVNRLGAARLPVSG